MFCPKPKVPPVQMFDFLAENFIFSRLMNKIQYKLTELIFIDTSDSVSTRILIDLIHLQINLMENFGFFHKKLLFQENLDLINFGKIAINYTSINGFRNTNTHFIRKEFLYRVFSEKIYKKYFSDKIEISSSPSIRFCSFSIPNF